MRVVELAEHDVILRIIVVADQLKYVTAHLDRLLVNVARLEPQRVLEILRIVQRNRPQSIELDPRHLVFRVHDPKVSAAMREAEIVYPTHDRRDDFY